MEAVIELTSTSLGLCARTKDRHLCFRCSVRLSRLSRHIGAFVSPNSKDFEPLMKIHTVPLHFYCLVLPIRLMLRTLSHLSVILPIPHHIFDFAYVSRYNNTYHSNHPCPYRAYLLPEENCQEPSSFLCSILDSSALNIWG